MRSWSAANPEYLTNAGNFCLNNCVSIFQLLFARSTFWILFRPIKEPEITDFVVYELTEGADGFQIWLVDAGYVAACWTPVESRLSHGIPDSLVGDSRGRRILRQTQIIYAGLPHVLRTGGESALANDNAWSFNRMKLAIMVNFVGEKNHAAR